MYDQELIVFKWLSIPLTPQLARKPIALTHNSKAGHPLQREKVLVAGAIAWPKQIEKIATGTTATQT